MKYIFILSFFFLALAPLDAQKSTYIKGKGYDGYIFDKNHFIFLSIKNQKERYTPTLDDIKLAERILKDSVDTEMEKYCPYPCKLNGEDRITKKYLRKYKRQYVGFLTNEGDIIVYINLLKDKGISKEKLSSDIVMVLDGGSNYWMIYINITKRELFGLSINGIS